MSQEKVKKKRISGEAYDINKQTIYTEERDQKIEERNTPRSPHRTRELVVGGMIQPLWAL